MTNENTTFRPLDSLQVMAYIVDILKVVQNRHDTQVKMTF